MSHVDEGVLHSYLDGELTSVERARVDEHLAGCLACRTRLAEERALIGRASKLLGLATPVERPAPPLHQLKRPRVWWQVRMPLAWAATVALALGVGFWFSGRTGDQGPAPGQRGPIALRETQGPRDDKPAPAPTTTRRLEKARGNMERQAPAVAQKPAARRDSSVTDQLANASTAAEERNGAAAPVRALAPRMQAAELDEARPALDSAAARAMLGREPLAIPGLAVRHITRSARWPDEVLVEQALDSTNTIVLWERPVPLASSEAAPVATRGATVAKAAPDYVGVGRMIDRIWVQITGPVSVDSLRRLVAKIAATPPAPPPH